MPIYLAGGGDLPWLIAGVIVMDAAMQALNVIAAGSLAYDHFGWTGATTTAAALSIGGLLGTLGTHQPEKQHPARHQTAKSAENVRFVTTDQ